MENKNQQQSRNPTQKLGLPQDVVSHVTNQLAQLKTLTDGSQQPDFTVFTHQKLQKQGQPVPKTYKDLREAILELYLQVKIRDDAEIEVFNEQMYN